MGGIPSVFPPFLFASAGNSGGSVTTRLAGGLEVELRTAAIEVAVVGGSIEVTVTPSTIVAGS